MVKNLMPIVLSRSTIDNKALVDNMTRGILRGDLSSALLHLRSYIAGIPYDIITREEWDNKEKREGFYKLLMYMVFSILNSKVRCENKCGVRIDSERRNITHWKLTDESGKTIEEKVFE